MSTTPPSDGAHDDSDLRRLLNDAVSDVNPSGGPAEIRSRTRRPSSDRWLPITLAAAVATVLVIGGTTWLGQRDAGNAPAAGSSEKSVEATPTPGRTVDVPVFYVGRTGSGPRLFQETLRITAAGSNLQVAVQKALSDRPLDDDYSAWGPAKGLEATVTAGENAITIDLTGFDGRSFNALGGDMDDEDAHTYLQALVWTADAASSSDLPVRFLVDGRPIDRLLATDTSVPVARAGADSVLAPVSITSPAEGETVPTEFGVRGDAATFEANVVWELKQGDEIVRKGFTTAKECCTLSPYSFTVTAPAGDYLLVVHDTDESDGEGNGVTEDTKHITVG